MQEGLGHPFCYSNHQFISGARKQSNFPTSPWKHSPTRNHWRGHGCCGTGPTDTIGRSEPLQLVWGPWGWCSPDQVGETSVQVHGGGWAAEHGQNALQVQKLQLLVVTAEQHRHNKARLRRWHGKHLANVRHYRNVNCWGADSVMG